MTKRSEINKMVDDEALIEKMREGQVTVTWKERPKGTYYKLSLTKWEDKEVVDN